MEITQDKIEAVRSTMQTPGWAILEEYLREVVEQQRARCEIILEDHRYNQGIAFGLRIIERITTSFKTSVAQEGDRNTTGWGKSASTTMPPVDY